MPELINSEAKIRYDLAGEGETLVLIPGFASGTWSWKHQVADFSRRFRVLTFDPRGVGGSELHDGASASIEKIASDVLEILDREKIERAHLLGMSFGGFVAQRIAVSHGDRVSKLVLACTSAGGPQHVPPDPAMLAALGSFTGDHHRDRRQLELAFTPGFAATSASVVDDFCTSREANPVPANVHADQLAAAFTFDARADLKRITSPTLVLTGDRDEIVPAANSVRLAAEIPDARLQVIAGAGHMFFVESPRVFNSAVIDFLLEK